MVRKHGSPLHEEEINEASWVAARGAIIGAAKWGIFSLVAAGCGYAFSPMYRGLTFQFKVFLQMSGMTLGSMIEADQRLRSHEVSMRTKKKLIRDEQVWRQYQQDFDQEANYIAQRRVQQSTPRARSMDGDRRKGE